MITVLNDFLQTLFPTYCLSCRRAVPPKTTLCLHCISELPITNYHLSTSNPLLNSSTKSPPLRLQHLWSFLKNKDLCSNSFISWSIWTKNNLGVYLEVYWERNCLIARFQLAILLCQSHFIGAGKEKGGTTKSHNLDSSLPNSSMSNTSTETSFEARRQKP